MKFNNISNFIRKNFFIIAIGISALVLLVFLSENFRDDRSSIKNGDDLEVRLESFLTNLQGVGECDVIVFTETDSVSSFSATVSECISGIAVICEGGGDIAVKTMIIDILTRLFGISGSRISINAKG